MLNGLFWGKKKTFVGKYLFWVMNDHLRGPSVHVDKSLKKSRPPPPHPRNAWILGTFGTATPPSMVKAYMVHSSHVCPSGMELFRMRRVESQMEGWVTNLSCLRWGLYVLRAIWSPTFTSSTGRLYTPTCNRRNWEQFTFLDNFQTLAHI